VTARHAFVVALVVGVMLPACSDRPSPTIVVEDVATDLLTAFRPEAVVSAPADAPVALASVTPGDWMRGDGPRPALTMPPPSRVRLRVTVPAGAVLRFGAGVGGVTRREADRSGIRFTVQVNGVERWARTIDPSGSRRDRRWFDERIPLEEGSVDLELATAIADPGHVAPGVPGWSRLQVVIRTAHPRQPAAASAPNVLVLLVDTLRADCVGGTPTLTPNLDALGARGLVFDRAIAQSSWTLQSVPSILTGLIPPSHGVRGNFWGESSDDEPSGEHLPDAIETFAEAAARTGISTIGVSANPLVSRGTNMHQGFETFHEFTWDPKERRFASAAEVNDVFLEWLRHHRGVRFLGYLHYMDPHDPYTPPPHARPPAPAGMPEALAGGWILETARKINAGAVPKLSEPYLAHLRRLYHEEVRAWDATLPALLAGLRDAGVLDSTVVVVTSDHGEEFQEHGGLKHGQSLHEELVHVPLVIVGPGVSAGRRTAQVQGIDLYPTLGRILGFPVPAATAARDLLAADVADAVVVSQTDHAVVDGGAVVDSISLRTPEWTLLTYPASGRSALFHRPDDPTEHHDRFATDPAAATIAADLQARLAAAPPAPPSSPIAGDLGHRLRALGYAQ
jgi:arylsulfatase A-like enzyme